ncbi:hypothetical protein EJB05_31536 [Eragrostis curvula]|uniref:F-box domain-containing protein n=1 Tax=Eragrostis curvula TaxID=38414 RepID=A0A5J9UEA6_9POAL|nr:hypothetical protein EJB05_31536 [Eragrostis curvula]
MELNNENRLKAEEDMISRLIDDVLLYILGKVNLKTTMRASVLSTRWRHLPWLLTQLSMDISDFLHKPYDDLTVDVHIDKAMSSLTEAVRNMLVPTRRKITVTRLCIFLFLNNSYSREIGFLVNEVIANGMIKDIELTSGVERIPGDVSAKEMVKHASGVNSFLGSYPNISCCLTRLLLYNATFVESDLHNLIANICTELRYLYLYQCDTGFDSVFKIDAQNSKLNRLEFAHCSFARVELYCLPNLEQLICGCWLSECLPLALGGHVPCLKEVEIYSALSPFQEQFKLSELLCGTTCINTLSLDFLGYKIWLQPENYQLSSPFCNLMKLCLYDIFVGFGLLWTIALLQAAPSLEILEVEVYDHRCDEDKEMKQVCAERANAEWEVSGIGHKLLLLTQLEIIGFNASEEHMSFIGAVMERAPNLQASLDQLKKLGVKDLDAFEQRMVTIGHLPGHGDKY